MLTVVRPHDSHAIDCRVPRSRAATLCVLALLAGSLVAQEGPGGRLREVRITVQDVFDPQRASERPLEAMVNGLHWTTREATIAREVFVRSGERIDASIAAELERNLRALGLFAEVTVRLVATDDPDLVDLEITTRDRLTLQVGAGASYVGGVGGLRGQIGDNNLFGLGDRFAGSFARNTEGEYRGSVVYSDLHVLDSWHTGTARYSRTDEGDSYGLEIRRPFKHLADPRSQALTANHDEAGSDYYRDGDTAATIHDVHDWLHAELLWGSGPRDARHVDGFVFDLETHDYDPAAGPFAATVRTPSDSWSAALGVTARWHWVTAYRKVEGLDTLDYVQDLTLGTSCGATAGVRWRDEFGAAGDLQPFVAGRAHWAGEPLPDWFVVVGLGGDVRWDGGETVGWQADAQARTFVRIADRHTFAARVAFDAAEEAQDLPAQLTLGEDTGLRGYRLHQFAGTRRLRGNLEERCDTGVDLLTLHFGLVAFVDAGMVGEGHDLGAVWTAAGGGLRIGSRRLLGGGVVRIDVARPLDAAPGEDRDWLVSLAVGQVVSF